MNNQTKTQENVKKALAKQTLGLPLTPHEHALVTLYGQSPVSNKKYLRIIGRYKTIVIYIFEYFVNADTDTTATAIILLAILRRTT